MLHNLNFIDIHYHVNPDSYRRRYNSIKAGKIYKDLKGMVVLKNHLGSSVAIAETAYLENLPVLGSLVLNKIAGETWKTIIQQNLCMYNKIGVNKLLLNQPANPIVGLIANDLRQLSKYKFIYFEQTALTYLLNYQNYQDFVDVIANIPNVIYSSDLGQTSQMDIQEWLINSHKWFRNAQLSETRIQDITLNNPLKLLSI